MSALRSIRILNPDAQKALHNDACRDGRYLKTLPKVRKSPKRVEAWEERRRQYLEECGREEKPAPLTGECSGGRA